MAPRPPGRQEEKEAAQVEEIEREVGSLMSFVPLFMEGISGPCAIPLSCGSLLTGIDHLDVIHMCWAVEAFW